MLYPIYKHSLTVKDKRKRLLCMFDKLDKVPKYKEPTFAFADLDVTHPPFVFTTNGDLIDRPGFNYNYSGSDTRYIPRYLDQVKFANKKLTSLIKTLITESETPPIIIIQADHGTNYHLFGPNRNSFLRERTSILNALYLPHGGKKLLYPNVSPVNTFRIVFNYYFGADYPLLKDRIDCR